MNPMLMNGDLMLRGVTRLLCAIIIYILISTTYGCVKPVLIYNVGINDLSEHASLNISSNKSGKSNLLLLQSYHMYIDVYAVIDDKINKVNFLGRKTIKNDDNITTIYLATDQPLILSVHYNDTVRNIMSQCIYSFKFKPENKKAYDLNFKKKEKECSVELLDKELNELVPVIPMD